MSLRGQPPKDHSFNHWRESSLGRRGLECLNSSPPGSVQPRSGLPDGGQRLQWGGALLVCSSGHLNGQEAVLEVLWRERSMQSRYFWAPIFPLWSSPVAASGCQPDVPVCTGLAWVAWDHSWASPVGPHRSLVDSGLSRAYIFSRCQILQLKNCIPFIGIFNTPLHKLCPSKNYCPKPPSCIHHASPYLPPQELPPASPCPCLPPQDFYPSCTSKCNTYLMNQDLSHCTTSTS